MNQESKRKRLCSFPEAKDFTTFINALRRFTNDNHPYMLLEVVEPNVLVGFSCDGMKLARQVFQGVFVADEPFSVYLNAPRFCPSSDDGVVYLTTDSDKSVYLEFGDVSVRTTPPQNALDFHKLYDSVRKPSIGKVVVNRSYLRDVATSLYVAGDSASERVAIEIQNGAYSPLKLSSGKNERYILPIRQKNDEFDVLSLQNMREFIYFLANEHASAVASGVNGSLWSDSPENETKVLEQLEMILDTVAPAT